MKVGEAGGKQLKAQSSELSALAGMGRVSKSQFSAGEIGHTSSHRIPSRRRALGVVVLPRMSKRRPFCFPGCFHGANFEPDGNLIFQDLRLLGASCISSTSSCESGNRTNRSCIETGRRLVQRIDDHYRGPNRAGALEDPLEPVGQAAVSICSLQHLETMGLAAPAGPGDWLVGPKRPNAPCRAWACAATSPRRCIAPSPRGARPRHRRLCD